MHYPKNKTKEIVFPLGGIGTGSIGFFGNGKLRDFEVFNRPAKGTENGYTHLALRMKTADRVDTILLCGDIQKDYMGEYGRKNYRGYGFGPSEESMAGFRHFDDWSFDGEFPIARLNLSDSTFPAMAAITAWNPMIPGDDKNSSIPAAFFDVDVTNTSEDCAEMTVAFSFRNPYSPSRNTKLPSNCGVFMKNAGVSEEDVSYGDFTLTAVGDDVFALPNWYRGSWMDELAMFWREFNSADGLKYRDYESDRWFDMCTVSSSAHAEPGETVTFHFILTWNIPNNYNYWNPCKDENGRDITWKNYYATLWKNSAASAEYAVLNRESLFARTAAFRDALWDSSLDPVFKDAVASNLAVLHSPTVLRLENGALYGWEGCRSSDGSCEGSCTHVWNYAYAVCYLFPSLERSMRELDFTYCQHESGAMRFRMPLPLGRDAGPWLMPCVDGQMGGVIKLYREWKICGDDEWLRSLWPAAKRSLEFAWSENNPLRWDENKDGILEGRQHHTLDMELYGASSWLEGMYLAALKAGAEIAEYLGEHESAAEYMSLFKKGSDFTESELWGGKWYIQKIDLTDKTILEKYAAAVPEFGLNDAVDTYWNSDVGEIKYQIKNGSEIDQVLAEWHASLVGLGSVFDSTHLRVALSSMFEHNFFESFRGFTNMWRNFSLDDEGGTVMTVYPKDTEEPAISIPYTTETMTGFEYAFAGLLIKNGFINEAKRVVKAIRDRYDGEKRNPFNEIECGSNYARSMASFALLPLSSGFTCDLPHSELFFDPISLPCRTFWSVDGAWGTAEIDKNSVVINVIEGKLKANRFCLPCLGTVSAVKHNGTDIAFSTDKSTVIIEAFGICGTLEIK